jgi:hypothetical protein
VITGLPDYRPPIEQSLRCVCGQRFVFYLGAPFPFYEMVFEAASERAAGVADRPPAFYPPALKGLNRLSMGGSALAPSPYF